MRSILWINSLLSFLFLTSYGYQFVYLLYALAHPGATAPVRRQTSLVPSGRRYAALICARNEEAVISGLLQSLKAQTYPADLLEVFVAADNCSDLTALVARREGATVFERFDSTRVGKGYALHFLLESLWAQRGRLAFDGYFIIDADNRLAPDFVAQMDSVYAQGYRVVTGYRASSNYGDNWISAGYSLWFLRESRFLNGPRMGLGTSCTVTGTGFLVHPDIFIKNGGWKHFLITEDVEFSTDCILAGERIAYSPNAVFYDEQPVRFSQSWRQRLRWCKGYLQVLRHYGLRLARGMVAPHGFACFDIIMSILPALSIGLIGCTLNLGYGLWAALWEGGSLQVLLGSFLGGIGHMYATLYFIGLTVTVAEWKRVACSPFKKLLYTFTFPLFTFTYLPISIAALFQPVEWKPIYHGADARHPKKAGWLHLSRIRGKIEVPR
ncbi:MAG: glycosyltransferase [Clostridia bacterium]|nr:glycosyltransferase [Clostridia bacterium]